MSWCKFFSCFSRCRRSNRVGQDVTVAPKGPQPMNARDIPPVLVLPDVAQNIDDIELRVDDGFRL